MSEIEMDEVDPRVEEMAHQPGDDLRAQPKTVVLVFTGADDGRLHETAESVIGFAEDSGLFLMHASTDDMNLDDVVPGSPLHQIVTGIEPRD